MTQIKRFDSNSRRSRAVVHGNTIYLAGQVCDDIRGNIAQQTNEVLAKIDQLLKSAGGNKSNILSATIWLKTMDDFDAMNAIWDAWVDAAQAPARSCGTAGMADPGYLIEITMTAAT